MLMTINQSVSAMIPESARLMLYTTLHKAHKRFTSGGYSVGVASLFIPKEAIMFNALKTKFQHRHRRAAIIAVLGLSLGGLAYAAAPEHCGGPGMRHGNPEQMQKMMQSRLEKMLQEINATEAQKSQLKPLAEQAFAEMKIQRKAMGNDHDELRKLFSQNTVDAAQLETLRTAKIKVMDDSSRKLTALVAEASRILTPEQRLKLVEKMEKRCGHRSDKNLTK